MKQLDGKYPYQHSGPRPGTREYDVDNFMKAKTRKRRELMPKVKLQNLKAKVESFFANNPTYNDIFDAPYEDFAACCLGELSLIDVAYANVSEGDFDYPIRIDDLCEAIADKISETIQDIFDLSYDKDAKISLDEFKDIAETALEDVMDTFPYNKYYDKYANYYE